MVLRLLFVCLLVLSAVLYVGIPRGWRRTIALLDGVIVQCHGGYRRVLLGCISNALPVIVVCADCFRVRLAYRGTISGIDGRIKFYTSLYQTFVRNIIVVFFQKWLQKWLCNVSDRYLHNFNHILPWNDLNLLHKRKTSK